MSSISSSSTSSSLRSTLMSIYKRNINVNDGNDNHTIYKQQHEKSITNQTKNDSLPSSSSSSPSSFILRNPQSLLSYDPNQLCRLLNLNLQQVLSLRDEISKTIVLDDTIGNSTSLISYYDNDNNNNNVDNNNNNNDNNNITCDIQMKNQYKRKRIMNGLIHGSMTAKELYQLSFLSSSSTAASSSSSAASTSSLILSSSTSSTSQNNIIQTGSQVLDILLSTHNNDDGDNIDNINKRQRLYSSSSATTNTTSNNNNNNKYGIEIGTITEICGISSSGKTQLVLSIAAETIVSNYINNNNSSRSSNSKNFKVYYIAGGGGSTSLISLARRFRQLCRSKLNIALGNNNNNNINNSTSMNQNHDDVLNRIKFIPVGDNPYYLLAELNHIESEMKKNISAAVSATTTTIEDNSNNILLIIDSISGCLSSYLYADGDGGLGAGIMNEISLILRRLSRMTTVVHTSKNNEKSMDNDVVVMNQCTVLITNGMVMDGNSNSTRMHKPALGESWRAADVRLILERVQNLYEEDDNQQQQVSSSRSSLRNNGNRLRISTSTIVNARLEKHFSKSCFPPKAITFAIDTSGVLDVKK